MSDPTNSSVACTTSMLRIAEINRTVARAWRAAGVDVFPCSVKTKAPCVKGWREPQLHRASWLKHWSRPGPYLPGIDCEGLRLVVVDCDVRDNYNGVESFHKLCIQEGVRLESLVYSSTPSGGRHYFFKQPDGLPLKNSVGRVAQGIDIRGVGGFIIAPGSTLPDRRCYSPDNGSLPDMISLLVIGRVAERTLSTMPLKLAERVRAASLSGRIDQTGMAKASNVVSSANIPTVISGINAALSSGIQGGWSLNEAAAQMRSTPAGTRNETLNRLAFIAGRRIRAGNTSSEEAQIVLSEAALDAGLEAGEIARTLESGLSAGMSSNYLIQNDVATAQNDEAPWDRTEGGKLKSTLRNTKLAVTKLGIKPQRDTFRDQVMLNGSELPEQYCGALTNYAEIWLRNRILDQLGFDPGAVHTHDALTGLAETASYNPVTDEFDTLMWDYQKRLGNWVPRVTGADDTRLNRWAGIGLVTAIVARARYPGTKFDTCVVLEGPQGCGKSSLAKALAGEGYFTDAPGLLSMDAKARAELLVGRKVVELAELSGLARSEVEVVKAFISQSTDQYRPAYARVAVSHPRTCVLIGTTNSSAYLADSSGNRRFLPVKCGPSIDLKTFTAEREQLFAEADYLLSLLVEKARADGHVIQSGRPLPDPVAMDLSLPAMLRSEAADAAEERRAVDPGEDILREIVSRLDTAEEGTFLPDGRRFLPSADLARALRAELSVVIPGRTLASWMGRLGWERTKQGRGSGQVRGYARKLCEASDRLERSTSGPGPAQ